MRALPGPCPWIARIAGPGSVRSCGTRRYAGTDIVASVSNTTRSRRYEPQSTVSVVSRSSGTGSGAGPSIGEQPLAHRAAPRLELRGEIVERARVGVDRGLVSQPPVRPVGEVAAPAHVAVTRRRRAPSRGRPTRWRRYAGVSHAPGKWPRLVENTRPSPSAKHHASGYPNVGGRAPGAVEIELAVADAQQHLRVGAQIAELVHLVVPLPLGAEVRARRMRRVEHVGDEGLRPRMTVEPGADELAVVGPA